MANEANVLVIGSGGREHTICWKLSQSPDVANIFVAPGNIGIASVNKVQNVALDVKNHPGVVQWSINHNINLVVVGPEDPLADGLVDSLTAEGNKIYIYAKHDISI